MPTVDSYKPGTFCWADLATNDPAAAKEFYTQLFGWDVNDIPMDDGSFYTMLQKDGRNAAALAQQQADELEAGVPPHWMLYICVDDADAVTDRAAVEGGTVLVPPMDVSDNGRFAVLRDPGDAVVGLWQPKEHIGAGVAWEPGSMCWFELQTRDRVQSRTFYCKVFGWTTKGDDSQYTQFEVGGKAFAGMMEIDPSWGPVPPNWGVYFQVDNCDEGAAHATQLGGTVILPPQDIENTGRFAVLQDPQGAVFCIFQALQAD